MKGSLAARAAGKFLAGLIVISLILFLSAGTLRYWQGWLFIAILFAPMLAAGALLLKRRPELLEKRLDAKEKEDEQKAVLALSALMFAAAFIAAGLDRRFGISRLPAWTAWAAAALFLAGYAAYAEVMRENAYLSRTVGVQEGQKVVSTGLYGVVRHPMYSATIIMFLSMGIVLGSLISFGILLFYVPITVKRIRNEEKVLAEGLDGYAEYMEKIRWRLIPHIW